MGGYRIGDLYELKRVLGQGGMGTVYAARDLRTGGRVAIKHLRLDALSPREQTLARFEREARIAGSLDSPHVARVLDIVRDPATGEPFIVMERLVGEDMQALLDRVGALAPDTALRIAAQAGAGLTAAHAAGVVHRDIKPANLFLSRQGEGEVVVKILDFGLAKIRPAAPGATSMTSMVGANTTTGRLMGSPLYMSPEQVDAAKDIDARSDVFSLGVTLYAALTGAPPRAFVPSLVELLLAIATRPPPPVTEAAPWVSPAIAAIVARATCLAREERYPSAAALVEGIRPLLAEGMALREELLVGSESAPRRVIVSGAGGDPFGPTV